MRQRAPRGTGVAVGVAGALLVAALLGGRPGRDGPPLDPRSDAPDGTSALVSLLDGLGARVDLSVGMPEAADDIALLLEDHLDTGQHRRLDAWVHAGGTLVVTDPFSPLVPVVEQAAFGDDQQVLEPGTCTVDALAEVGEIEAGAAGRFPTDGADGSCFGAGEGEGAFLVTRPRGSGRVVAVAGAAFLVNDLLDERDNAVLAAALLAPTDRLTVRVVEAPVPAGGGDKTLGDLVPGGVKRALLQLGIAFALYALWRAIRLGRPVLEDPPVAVAGSELVAATGRLLSRTRSPAAAGAILRDDLRRALRSRLGVPAAAELHTLAEVAAARSTLTVDEVLAAVDERPITTDDDLVAVARAVASVHQEVLP